MANVPIHHAVFIDECHIVLSKELGGLLDAYSVPAIKALTDSRKFHVTLWLATQSPGSLHPVVGTNISTTLFGPAGSPEDLKYVFDANLFSKDQKLEFESSAPRIFFCKFRHIPIFPIYSIEVSFKTIPTKEYLENWNRRTVAAHPDLKWIQKRERPNGPDGKSDKAIFMELVAANCWRSLKKLYSRSSWSGTKLDALRDSLIAEGSLEKIKILDGHSFFNVLVITAAGEVKYGVPRSPQKSGGPIHSAMVEHVSELEEEVGHHAEREVEVLPGRRVDIFLRDQNTVVECSVTNELTESGNLEIVAEADFNVVLLCVNRPHMENVLAKVSIETRKKITAQLLYEYAPKKPKKIPTPSAEVKS